MVVTVVLWPTLKQMSLFLLQERSIQPLYLLVCNVIYMTVIMHSCTESLFFF